MTEGWDNFGAMAEIALTSVEAIGENQSPLPADIDAERNQSLGPSKQNSSDTAWTNSTFSGA